MGEERPARRIVKALDSNVVIRFIVGDDAQQAQLARDLIAQPCWIANTVLLEIGWVLQSRYGFDRSQIATMLRALLDIETVEMDRADLALWAIDRYEAGGDFADLVHLASSVSAVTFATFDRGLARAAGAMPPLPIETHR